MGASDQENLLLRRQKFVHEISKWVNNDKRFQAEFSFIPWEVNL